MPDELRDQIRAQAQAGRMTMSAYARALIEAKIEQRGTVMSEVQRWRKKPINIVAMQVTPDNRQEVADWCGGTLFYDNKLTISTLEGDMRADDGDFVICGVKGEFYPCKPDIFEASYERVDAEI